MRLPIRRRLIPMLATAVMMGIVLLGSPAARADIAITVDKDAQEMTVKVDGETRYRWPVSTGRPARETPNGKHRAFRLEPDHYSKEFDDSPMPHSIFFTKRGHAIHGTFSEKQIGTPVSAGCVRLSRAHAATLYKLVEEKGVLKTTVTLTGSASVALARNGGKQKPATAVARRAPAPEQITPEYDSDGYPITSQSRQTAASQPAERQVNRQVNRQVYRTSPIPGLESDDNLYAEDVRPAPQPRRTRRTSREAQAYYHPRQQYGEPRGYYYGAPAYVPAPSYGGGYGGGHSGGRGLFSSGW